MPDPALLYAAAKWDRVLTAGELTQLPTLMGRVMEASDG